MIVRIEFSESSSKAYPWAVRICRRFPSFRESVEDGMTVASVELTLPQDWYAFEVLAARIGPWKNSAFYLDGALISPHQIMAKHYDAVEAQDVAAERRREYGIPLGGTIDVDQEHEPN